MTKVQSLRSLERKRDLFRNIEWQSNNGFGTKIFDMDLPYLKNAVRKCVEKQIVAERLDWLPEAGIYQNRSYTEWIAIFKVEIQYRELLEVQTKDSVLEDLLTDYDELFNQHRDRNLSELSKDTPYQPYIAGRKRHENWV